jgi:VCBS repeat-containing protein
VTTYTGTNGNNTINGSNGDDTISGLGGQDTLNGGNGDDTVSGGTGSDLIDGGNSNDTLSGGDDNDTVTGGNGNDVVDGDGGNDDLSGGNGNDVVRGGSGNDDISGDNGDDQLTGGAGDDVIDGGNGFDTAYYSGNIGEYTFSNSGGYLHVVHLGGAGPDGHDQVKRVERLVFADRVIDLGSGNNAPVAVDDHVAINEDTGTYSSGAASVKDNDFDFEGQPLTVTPGNFTGTYGTLHLNSNGTYTYTLFASAQALAQGQNVTDSFNYTVSDGSHTDTGQLVFHIAGLNDAPVANPDSAAGTENEVLNINVLVNDTDVDNGAMLTVTAASVPPGQGTASVVGNQVQFDPGSDFDHLAAGATQVVTVNYSITDEFGATSSSTVSITVTGTNDGPVANPDTASTTENAAVFVDVLSNDTDADDGATLTVTAASAPAGQGSASVVSNQVLFDPGSDFDHLAVGDTEVVNVSYTITDENGATSSSTIAITVTGTNDGPVANPDTATTDENTAVMIDVLANDTDADDGAVLTVTSASAPPGQGTASVVGNQVLFDPGTDFDHLAAGASSTVLVTVNYSISDDQGATASSTIAVTVTGTNDGPVANPDTASTTENATVTVDVLTNDTDVDDGAVLTVTAASAPAGQGSAAVVGNQVEFDPGSDFDHLAVGETQVVNVSYSIEDEHGASSSSTIAITVTGTNDAPVINAGGTDASGSATELPDGDPGENIVVHSDSGTIAFSDADTNDTHSASFTPQAGGYVGTFTLDPVDQPGDSVDWHFNVSDADLDDLDEGETVTQTYTVTVDDGHGGTATQDVTITLTGADDAVGPDGTNWYIDNSAVGSTQDGSADNPYLSIAAFNAAQGTPTGPGVNDNVFLLAGTGTYAEADGINLLDGQVLTGVASGPLRPTIVAIAGDGVDLAMNNNVSGIDIGDTSGAGISDSGGSVGNAIISDVAKSGTGQIVDIDQGGTLNVTLNSAESLGSSGGAIDLDGVGGSFTVTGGTNITGVQNDGGIDITGSSLNATFDGGGTVSTLATTAVNFVGNSGSLTLAGGLDIVTTDGAGLNATGGGTVTVQGSGNSIAANGSGTALNIANTAIGAPGATFESISAGTAVGTAGVGISLVNTGTAGGLTVTGTGAAGSGGTIEHKTGAEGSTTGGIGIYLNNTSGVSLNNMQLNDFDNHAIRGESVGGIRVTNSTIGGVIGDASAGADAPVSFGTSGGANGFADGSSSLFQNVDISGGVEHNVEVYQQSGTFNLTVAGSTIHDNSATTGSDGLQIETTGTAHGIVAVSTTTFDDNKSQAVQATALGTSHLELTLNDNDVLTSTQGNEGFVLANGASGDLTVAVTDNNFTGVLGTNILVGSVAGNATSAAELNAIVSGNVMTLDGFATNRTLQALFSSTVGQVSTAKVTIDNNTINTIADPVNGLAEPLFVDTPDSGTDPLVYVSVTNNTVNIDDDANVALRGIAVQSRQSISQMHADVTGNIVNFLDGAGSAVGIRVRQSGSGTLDLEPGVGGANAAAVLAANNPGSTTQVLGTVTVSANNSVVIPPDAPASPSLPSFLLAGFDAGLLPAVHDNSRGGGLSLSTLGNVVETAIAHWSDAGASAQQIAAMRGVTISVTDLFGRELGASDAGEILIDHDGAGYGWAGSGGGMDLLTVVMHELGHAAGLGHDSGDDSDLMSAYLNQGEARLPDVLFETDAVAPAAVAAGDLAPLPPLPDHIPHFSELAM